MGYLNFKKKILRIPFWFTYTIFDCISFYSLFSVALGITLYIHNLLQSNFFLAPTGVSKLLVSSVPCLGYMSERKIQEIYHFFASWGVWVGCFIYPSFSGFLVVVVHMMFTVCTFCLLSHILPLPFLKPAIIALWLLLLLLHFFYPCKLPCLPLSHVGIILFTVASPRIIFPSQDENLITAEIPFAMRR